MLVSPKEADCTPASFAVKPPANNCTEVELTTNRITKSIVKMRRGFACRSAKIFFRAALSAWKICLIDKATWNRFNARVSKQTANDAIYRSGGSCEILFKNKTLNHFAINFRYDRNHPRFVRWFSALAWRFQLPQKHTATIPALQNRPPRKLRWRENWRHRRPARIAPPSTGT